MASEPFPNPSRRFGGRGLPTLQAFAEDTAGTEVTLDDTFASHVTTASVVHEAMSISAGRDVTGEDEARNLLAALVAASEHPVNDAPAVAPSRALGAQDTAWFLRELGLPADPAPMEPEATPVVAAPLTEQPTTPGLPEPPRAENTDAFIAALFAAAGEEHGPTTEPVSDAPQAGDAQEGMLTAVVHAEPGEPAEGPGEQAKTTAHEHVDEAEPVKHVESATEAYDAANPFPSSWTGGVEEDMVSSSLFENFFAHDQSLLADEPAPRMAPPFSESASSDMAPATPAPSKEPATEKIDWSIFEQQDDQASKRVVCPVCGGRNYDFVSACSVCSHELVLHCPHCAAPNGLDATLCEACGKELTAEAVARQDSDTNKQPAKKRWGDDRPWLERLDSAASIGMRLLVVPLIILVIVVVTGSLLSQSFNDIVNSIFHISIRGLLFTLWWTAQQSFS